MIVLYQKPPNYHEIKNSFNPPKGTVFSYGNVIYNPDSVVISTPLLAHEEVHGKQQQEIGVKMWWYRYIHEPAFRISQEIPAYQIQYSEAKKLIKDKNKQIFYLKELSDILSSSMYGKCISASEAMEAISSSKLFTFDTRL